MTDEHFRLLVETVEDYAIFMLDPEGFVQSWNAGAERIKGYTADEVIGQHFSVFYSVEDRAARRWDEMLREARRASRAEDAGWRVRKDGSRFWASTVLTALHGPGGDVIGFAKVTRDLTDRAYRAFVETTNGLLWTTDASGQPNADSPSWRAFTGQTEDDWRGRRAYDPVHPDDRKALEAGWVHARATNTVFVSEFRLRRTDGVYVWMAARAVPFLDAAGGVREWFGLTFDISDRKAAELAREQALTLWATTLRSIGDGVIATDTEGRVTFMNPVAEQLTGWTTPAARGKRLVEVFPIFNENTREPVENPVEKVMREGVVVGLANHTILVRRDGSERPIDDSAAPIRMPDGTLDGVVLVFRDASQEKLELARRNFLARAGDELIQASDYRTALAKIATLAVPRLADWCAIDIIELGSLHPHRLAVAHIDPSKVTYAHELAERYPPDPHAQAGVPNVLRTGKSELFKELPFELLDAAAIDEDHRRIIHALDLRSAMVVPLRGRERTFGAISFIYTGARRYTEDDLVFAEELARRAAIVVERRRLEEDAMIASRAKDEFLAMLGHELRNPLAPIRTALQLMTLRGDPATLREREVIERQVNHLVTLVDDLLDVSRITRSKIKLDRAPVELSLVIARALEMASPLLEQRQHHLELAVPRTGLVVDGDPARLAQVFQNLLTNAAKYTDPGGHITVTATRHGSGIVASVKDTGVGIAPEMLPSIFEMFVQERQTIERSQGGLGLGLSIVRSLVTMHGGSVDVTSAGRGQGSTFTVELPAVDAVTTPPEIVEPRTKQPHDVRTRVLVVDDNEDAATMLEEILRTYGYITRVAFDGPSALKIAAELEPQIALLDIGLPVMDGYELAERMRALPNADPGLRLVALTGYGQDKDQQRAARAGFDRHLVKPVSLELVRRTISELVG